MRILMLSFWFSRVFVDPGERLRPLDWCGELECVACALEVRHYPVITTNIADNSV